jgi:ParB-like chromosome segregation protein Spo0J
MAELNIQYYKANDLIMAEYNPRQLTRDQYAQLKDSLTRFGLVDPLIVNKHKDRKNILVGGHQRLKIAKEMGMSVIPCVEVELPYDQEKELNIRLNKNVGEWDYDALANYFDVGELTEWGFSEAELGFRVHDLGAEWTGMPDFEQEDLSAQRQIIVSFANNEDVKEFSKLMNQSITPKTRSIWYPKAETESMTDRYYGDKNES